MTMQRFKNGDRVRHARLGSGLVLGERRRGDGVWQSFVRWDEDPTDEAGQPTNPCGAHNFNLTKEA